MPYNPTPAQKAKNKAEWEARHGLSDEELFGTALPDEEGLSDEELFGTEDTPSPLRKDANRDERSAAQGLNVIDTATFGFGDEVVGGLTYLDRLARTGSTKEANKAYDEEVKYARDLKKRWRADPNATAGDYASYGLGLVAGAPASVPLFRGGQIAARLFTAGKPAATMVGRGLQAAMALGLTGAGASEAYQFGEAEGGLDKRLEAIGAGGMEVPLVGAGLGIAAGGLGAGGSRVIQRVAQGFRSGENQAARYLAEKLLGAGQTVDDLAAAHGAAAKTGKPVTLGDVGPQGIKDAGAAAARTPGPGRETAQKLLVPRQEGQVQRVSTDVGDAVGGKPGSFTQTVDEISAQRSAEAKPLYDKAMHSKPLVSPKIVEVTNRPSGKAAMDRGLKIARDEGIPENELVSRDANGNVTGYTTKALHYMKMGLDDMIESAQRSGDNAASRAFTIMKNELLGEMDRLNPAYAQARKVFAGHAANQRALEAGRKATNAHPDAIRSEMAGMSEAERDMYRRGFAQKTIEEVERTPDAGNAARRIMGNTAKRERIRAVLGDEEFAKLQERLGVEDAMYGSYKNTNAGAQTAERVAAQNDMEEFFAGQTPEVAEGVAQVMRTGLISTLIHRIGYTGVASLLRGISQRARGHIARMLFSERPEDVRAALQTIAKEYAAAQRFTAAQDATIAGLTANDKARAGAGMATDAAYGYSPVQPF